MIMTRQNDRASAVKGRRRPCESMLSPMPAQTYEYNMYYIYMYIL